ncbi:hypothetical protein ABIC09_007352 [Bradyrhizobium sp. S3.12.5]
MPMTDDERSARAQTCRNNIQRYRQLLQTRLTEFERDFIAKRLSEESSELERLANALTTSFDQTAPG